MLAVFAISHVDAKLALPQAKRIFDLGGCRGHSALIVANELARKFIPEIEAELRKSFDAVEVFYPNRQFEEGWPGSSNHFFKQASVKIDLDANAPYAFYFIEPDCTPLKRGWLDALEHEYRLCGKPFMGVVHATTKVRYQDGITTPFIDGEHMVGTGIYPKNTPVVLNSLSANIFECIDDGTVMRLPPAPSAMPWDVFLQSVIVPHCHPTKLIQHSWKCINFRRDEAGNIIHDQLVPYIQPEPIRADAVIHHGCKDGSLIELLTEKKPEPAMAVKAAEKIVEKAAEIIEEAMPKVVPHGTSVNNGNGHHELNGNGHKEKSPKKPARLTKSGEPVNPHGAGRKPYKPRKGRQIRPLAKFKEQQKYRKLRKKRRMMAKNPYYLVPYTENLDAASPVTIRAKRTMKAKV